MANTWPGTGLTWPVMLTATAISTTPSGRNGSGATGSSTPTTAMFRLIEFTIEQLAGDLASQCPDQQSLATGFNRNHGITIEGGIIDEEYRTEYVMDRLVTTGSVWMGQCRSAAPAVTITSLIRDVAEGVLRAVRLLQPGAGARHARLRSTGEHPLTVAADGKHSERGTGSRNSRSCSVSELNNPRNVDERLRQWTTQIAEAKASGWRVSVSPAPDESTGWFNADEVWRDDSILVGGSRQSPARRVTKSPRERRERASPRFDWKRSNSSVAAGRGAGSAQQLELRPERV